MANLIRKEYKFTIIQRGMPDVRVAASTLLSMTSKKIVSVEMVDFVSPKLSLILWLKATDWTMQRKSMPPHFKF